MKAKITDAYCYYTGGGVYVYSAKYGDNYLYGSFDQYITCLTVRGEILWQDEDVCEHYGWMDEMDSFRFNGSENSYILNPDKIEYPTWNDILKSLKNTVNSLPDGAESCLINCNPDLTKRTCED